MYEKILITVAGVLLFSNAVGAQNAVLDLKPEHAAALEVYLAENKTRSFRKESILNDEYLASMRDNREFGKTFKPNYAVGDFNGDKIEDFAMILNRSGKPEWPTEDKNRITEHTPDYPLTIVIFNGLGNGKFRLAFAEDTMGPAAAFIHFTGNKKAKALYYSIYETDEIAKFAASGKGYIID